MFRNLIIKKSRIINFSRRSLFTRSGHGRRHVVISHEEATTYEKSMSTSAAASTDSSSDAVQYAIRMLTDMNNSSKINEQIMMNKLHDFEKLIIEAKLSINDCVDASEGDLLDDDKDTAKDAVREAIDVFSDLRYDFRKSLKESDIHEKHSEIIENFSLQLDELKHELDSVLDETKRGSFLQGLDSIMNRIGHWRS